MQIRRNSTSESLSAGTYLLKVKLGKPKFCDTCILRASIGSGSIEPFGQKRCSGRLLPHSHVKGSQGAHKKPNLQEGHSFIHLAIRVRECGQTSERDRGGEKQT